MAELDAMIRMLYGSAEADPEVLRLLAVNGSGDDDALTFKEFLEVRCWCLRWLSFVALVGPSYSRFLRNEHTSMRPRKKKA